MNKAHYVVSYFVQQASCQSPIISLVKRLGDIQQEYCTLCCVIFSSARILRTILCDISLNFTIARMLCDMYKGMNIAHYIVYIATI